MSSREESPIFQSWNEWDPLERVLVGRALGARVPREDRSLRAINYADRRSDQGLPSGPYPPQVIEEAEADLARLCEELEKLGVQVDRPEFADPSLEFSSPHWRTEGYYSYCPRDSVLVHGSHLIEAPMPLRSRFYETQAYKSLFLEGLRGGCRWVCAPKPSLKDEAYRTEAVSKNVLTLNEVEPCFDAANVLRCGRDLFYLVSNSGNKLGAQWLQSYLGPEFRVHLLENMYSYMHLDSTISFLRPGLVLLNPSRVNEKNMPEVLRSWDKIWCDEPVDIGYHGDYAHASPWVGMNLLMVSPELAIVEENQKGLIHQLEAHRIEVLPLPVRHARTLGGGFHCVTLDLKRRGRLEDYLSSERRKEAQ